MGFSGVSCYNTFMRESKQYIMYEKLEVCFRHSAHRTGEKIWTI